MWRKIIRGSLVLLAFASIITTTSSCRGLLVERKLNSSPIDPEFNVRLFWSDFEYVGVLEGEIEFTQYAWGQRIYKDSRFNNQTETTRIQFYDNGLLSFGLNDFQSRALYDAAKKYPEIDFVVPIEERTQTNRMFLGRNMKYYIRAKAYRLRVQGPPVQVQPNPTEEQIQDR